MKRFQLVSLDNYACGTRAPFCRNPCRVTLVNGMFEQVAYVAALRGMFFMSG